MATFHIKKKQQKNISFRINLFTCLFFNTAVSHIPELGDAPTSPAGDVDASLNFGICENTWT